MSKSCYRDASKCCYNLRIRQKRGWNLRIVIVGGGISAVYAANAIMAQSPESEVLIVSDEKYPPYDRIHLCSLIDGSRCMDSIALELHPNVKLELNQAIVSIDPSAKRVYSKHAAFKYDTLIIATGSRPKRLFDLCGIGNAATFRSRNDCDAISTQMAGKNVVIVGSGPIALEMLDTLTRIETPKTITLLVRGDTLYSRDLNSSAVRLVASIFEQDPRVRIRFNDAIIDREVSEGEISRIHTRRETIEEPFVIFGVGIDPNIAFARDSLECDRGVLVDDRMHTSAADVYCIGEAAQVRENGFVAGRVKECTLQADAAVNDLLGKGGNPFRRQVSVDGLKVGSFLFADVTSPDYDPNDSENETILITHEDRIDQYIVRHDRLRRFIGINTNADVMHLKSLIESDEVIDPAYFYAHRLSSPKGKLICSCEGAYEQEIIELIRENAVTSFSELKPFSQAGRVCGKCKQDICALIERTPVDPAEAARLKAAREAAVREEKLAAVTQRIEKYNRLHPKNRLDGENLDEAIESFELGREFNRWVSMITASMDLHPDFEKTVKEGVRQLNKIPIIWLELADCSGNSEGFIKAAHPTIDDLILRYVSLDYHELLMAGSGDQSEQVLDRIIREDRGEYILIVEGAVPLGLEGKFLRIGPKGETGLELLRRVAQDAKAVMAVGSCALDGGVVAAEPNPTGAVGVAEALGRADIVNLPGCPVNPINIVGTLLHYIMFEEFPKLDTKNRPEWAYGFRVHDNCERRGHYDLGEFVLEWGDEGAKKGWCLFEMGCKGPYAELNCSLVKFNDATSWPVQAGHGCFGCGQGKIAFDQYANHRKLPEREENES